MFIIYFFTLLFCYTGKAKTFKVILKVSSLGDEQTSKNGMSITLETKYFMYSRTQFPLISGYIIPFFLTLSSRLSAFLVKQH